MDSVRRISKTDVVNGTSVIHAAGQNTIMTFLGYYGSGLGNRYPTSLSWNGDSFTELFRYQSSQIDGTYMNMCLWYLVNPTPGTANIAIASYGRGVLMQFEDVNLVDPFVDYDGSGGYSASSFSTDDMEVVKGAYSVGIGMANAFNGAGSHSLICDNSGLVTEKTGTYAGSYDYDVASCLVLNSTIKFTENRSGERCYCTGAVLRYQAQVLGHPIFF